MCSLNIDKTNKLFSKGRLALFFSSMLLCALAQPHRGWLLCALVSFAAFGLFFYAVRFARGKARFLLAFSWFFCVQVALLFWLATPMYQGFYVYGLLALLSALLGLQFALFTMIVSTRRSPGLLQGLMLSSVWTLMEWVRLFFLCGFVWNPLGLTLTATPYLAQLASIGGVYGLSFIVMLCNLSLYSWLIQRRGRYLCSYVAVCLFPLVFSLIYMGVHRSKLESADETLKVALVQTAIYPPEKQFFLEHRQAYIDPYVQWRRVVDLLHRTGQDQFDLIVLPEAAFGFGASSPVYECSSAVMQWLGFTKSEGLEQEYVSNLFFTKNLAKQFGSEVIIGLEESIESHHFLSAFFVTEEGVKARYDKRVLLPVAEYLPGRLFRNLAKRYGMYSFFTPGKEAGVFEGKGRYFPTICYEECFSEVVRQGKRAGGELLVNISNDAWYPHSKLNRCHFDHAKVRSIETGSYQIRACNTGVTSALDPFGRVVAKLEDARGDCEQIREALVVTIPQVSLSTWYARFGDISLMLVCFAFIVSFTLYGQYKRKKS